MDPTSRDTLRPTAEQEPVEGSSSSSLPIRPRQTTTSQHQHADTGPGRQPTTITRDGQAACPTQQPTTTSTQHEQPAPRQLEEETAKPAVPDPLPDAIASINGYWPDICKAIIMNVLLPKEPEVDNKPSTTAAAAAAAGVVGVGKPVVICTICCVSQLIIHGLCEKNAEGDDDIQQENGVLAQCGHVFGAECFAEWEKHLEKTGHPLTCPMCRSDLDPKRCDLHRLDSATIGLEEARNSLVDEVRPMGYENEEAASACYDCVRFGKRRREERGPRVHVYPGEFVPWEEFFFGGGEEAASDGGEEAISDGEEQATSDGEEQATSDGEEDS